MTEQEWNELGRRAVACKGWRWMAGMRVVSAGRWRVNSGGEGVVMRTRDGWATVYEELFEVVAECWGAAIRGELLPDLRDPATLGCMLALVRRAWEDDSELWGGRVEVHQDHRTVFTAVIAYHEGVSLAHRALARSGRNEAAALVAALEAAPKSGEAR